MRELPYNRAAAVAYARHWALRRNPAYYDFQGIGGDCTNFVSQCVYAGAKVMNYTPIMGWFYRSPSDRTPSWTGVQELYNFLVNNRTVGPCGHQVSQREVQPGDMVQLGTDEGDFYHSLVIISTAPHIMVAAHSYDALDKPLSAFQYDQVRFIHMDGVRNW